jgi:uncharacterized protein (TIGR01777 family)
VRALTARGDDVVRVVRSGSSGPGRALWDPDRGHIETSALEGIDAAVNLAGESIGSRRWTPRQKARIQQSRERGTGLLAQALADLTPRPRVLVSGSAMGFYGNRGDEVMTEDGAPGDGFLAMVARRWEEATSTAEDAGIRVCHVRTGLVLGRDGGLLKRILLPFRLGIGGRLGSGGQWMSWVSITDEVGAILHLLDDDEAHGPFNVAAPSAVRNDEFTTVLARVLRRPAVIPIPKALIAIPFGKELADDLLSSIRMVPKRLGERGFQFRMPELEPALRAELGR